jgi:hypothetical protein
MKSLKLVLWSGVTLAAAAAVAAGAVAATGKGSAVTTVKAVTKPTPYSMKVNRYIQSNMRWDKDVYRVRSGDTIHVVNRAADEGPHTFTIVKKKDAPKTGAQTVNCRVCNSLAKAHGADPSSEGPPKFPFLEDGVGQQTVPSIDKPGDSGLTGEGKKGESIDLKVTAAPGTKLWMICLIHPWMQSEISVN